MTGKRLAVAPGLAVALVLAVVLSTPLAATSQATDGSSAPSPSSVPPTPGRVLVDDKALFMVCEGDATEEYPTVVFENGLGEVYR